MKTDSLMASGRVCHGGRRYKRKLSDRCDEVMSPTINRNTVSRDVITKYPVITDDSRPFQRYKPLPAIGEVGHVGDTHDNIMVCMCIRLPDGRRHEITVATTTQLSYVVSTVLRANTDNDDITQWMLCTSEIPKRELNNLSLTLQDCGITKSCLLHLVPLETS